MEEIRLRVKILDGRKWILLNELDEKIVFRATAISKPDQVKDPSDHRAWQVMGTGSPKCTPKRFDITQFK